MRICMHDSVGLETNCCGYCCNLQFGNPVVLDKFIAGLDDVKKKKIQDAVAEAMGAPAPSAAAASAPSPVRTSIAAPVRRGGEARHCGLVSC